MESSSFTRLGCFSFYMIQAKSVKVRMVRNRDNRPFLGFPFAQVVCPNHVGIMDPY